MSKREAIKIIVANGHLEPFYMAGVLPHSVYMQAKAIILFDSGVRGRALRRAIREQFRLSAASATHYAKFAEGAE